MLRKLIGNLRRQPKQRRESVALGIASVFTFFVAVVWLINAPGSFGGVTSINSSGDSQTAGFMDQMSSKTAEVKEALTGEDSPQETLKDLVGSYQESGSGAAAATGSSSATSSTISATASTTVATSSASSQTQTSAEGTATESTDQKRAPREVRIQTVSSTAAATAEQ